MDISTDECVLCDVMMLYVLQNQLVPCVEIECVIDAFILIDA